MTDVAERRAQLLAEREALRARLEEIDAELGEPPPPRGPEGREALLLRAAFDATYQMITVVDTEGRVLDMNRTGLAATARTLDQVRGRTFLELQSRSPEMAARVHEAVTRTIHARAPQRLEGAFLPTRGDKSVAVTVTLRPLTSEDGEIFGVLIEGKDVSAERDAERASEAKLRSILDEIQVGVLSVSMSMKDTPYSNRAFEDIVGLQAGSLSTDPGPASLIPWVHPDDLTNARAARAARLRGESGAFECRIVRPDGETRWVRFLTSVVHASDGSIDRMNTIVVDRTDQRRAEEALNRSERRFRRMVERGWDLIVLADASGRPFFVSDSVERILGFTLEDYQSMARDDPRALPPSAELLALWPGLVAEPGGVRFLESHVATKDGRLRWMETVLVNLLDDPDVGAILANARDITARKEAEQAIANANADLTERVAEATAELQATNAALVRAARTKDEFLANMSHELRTPLNGVLGLTEALQECVYGPISDAQHAVLERITQSGHHLLSLLADILDLSKIESGHAALELTNVTIGEVCRASLTLVEGSAKQKRISVSVAMHDGFAAFSADERKLKQILVNLLSNAVKFTPEGGEAGLEVAVDPTEGQARFTVWDRGIGIAEEDLPRLFQPFVQLDSSLARAHPGTGLGLALVRRLVELHGGSIEVESQLGRGSRFTVRLPLSRRAPTTPPTGMTRALVVEDSVPAAEQAARHLREVGVEALLHHDARTAVARAAAEQPATILLDILLPAAVGWHVLRELRTDPRTAHIPVIVLSVLDRRDQAIALGAFDHFVKPATREALQEAVLRASSLRAPSLGDVRPVLVVDSHANRAEPRARRVLVAEDDDTNVHTVLDFLRAQGYEVFVARNGKEALEIAREVALEAILMDIQMPIVDGLTAIRELKSDARPEVRAVPIVALTALAMAGDRERCLSAGADGYMPKPVGLRRLAILLEELIGSPKPS